MSVGKSKIWKRREQTGLSRERVAASLDPPISSRTLERWEHGSNPVPAWRLAQLEAVYDAALGRAAAA